MVDRVSYRQWLADSLEFFSNLGFFANQSISDGSKLFEDLASKWSEINPDEDPEFSDLQFLKYDKERVWPVDGEFGVAMGANRYIDFMEGIAAISRGAFQPLDITEEWGTDEGPIKVTFTLDGELRELHPAFGFDWLDGAIIDKINHMIARSGMQIEMYDGSSQVGYLMLLTGEEKRKLIEHRNWRFFESRR